MSDAGRSLARRMRGAAALDVAVYEDVEHDRSATGQAAAVVALTAVAKAVGASGSGSISVIGAAAGALIGWLVWAGLTRWIGVRAFRGTATWGELLRTLGFAQSPNVLAVFGALPLVGWIVDAVLFSWVLVAGIVAIRQALDIDTGKAVLTGLIGAVVLGAFQFLF